MFRYILPIVLATGCFTVLADEPQPIKELPPDQEAAALRSAETAGLTIYRHDQAAAVATDAAFKVRKFKKDKRIKGWITEEQSGQIIVTFIDETPAALYQIAVSDGVAGKVEAMEAPTPLTTHQSGAAAARAAALASEFAPCSDSYNSVVLPSSDASGNWVVYLIPGTTKNSVIPIGGTYRLEISGSKVISQRGFTRTCITLENGTKVVALVMTHLLDPVPTEVHVFWSIWANKPFYISTLPNGTIWVVEGNKVRLVERKTEEG